MSHADALHAYLDGLLTEAPAAVEPVAPPAPTPTAPVALKPVPPPASTPAPAPRGAPPPAAAVPMPPHLSPAIARLFAAQSAPPEAEAERSVRWLCFLLAGQAYAVEVQKVQEVVRVPDIAPVAGAGGDTVGVMNLRGQIVQVISLRQRLGFGPGAPAPERRVVVLEEAGVVLGLLVDAVAEVFSVSAEAINDTGLVHGALPAEWFRGLLRRGNDLVVALDASRLLAH
jgi:purine-binding chemotaxis protein CheW